MSCAADWRSTTICVAIPAWSVPGLPQGVVTLHAVITDQGIHDRVVETVTHMQLAGDVRRRNHDAVRNTIAAGFEITLLFPRFVPAGFDGGGLKGLIHGDNVSMRGQLR